jgi:hypothetical protein
MYLSSGLVIRWTSLNRPTITDGAIKIANKSFTFSVMKPGAKGRVKVLTMATRAPIW